MLIAIKIPYSSANWNEHLSPFPKYAFHVTSILCNATAPAFSLIPVRGNFFQESSPSTTWSSLRGRGKSWFEPVLDQTFSNILAAPYLSAAAGIHHFAVVHPISYAPSALHFRGSRVGEHWGSLRGRARMAWGNERGSQKFNQR